MSVARRTTEVFAPASMRISRLCAGGSVAMQRTTVTSSRPEPPPSPLPAASPIPDMSSMLPATSSINNGARAAAAAARTAGRGRSMTNTDSAPSKAASQRLRPPVAGAIVDGVWNPSSASPLRGSRRSTVAAADDAGGGDACVGSGVGAADDVQSLHSGSNTAALYARPAAAEPPWETQSTGSGGGRIKREKARWSGGSEAERGVPSASENSAVTASAEGSGLSGVTRSTAPGDVER